MVLSYKNYVVGFEGISNVFANKDEMIFCCNLMLLICVKQYALELGSNACV